jgi:hypothetical protein
LNYNPDHWPGLSDGYSRMTQRAGGKTSVGNGNYNGLFKLSGGQPLGTVGAQNRVVYHDVMTVSCRHVVSCRDGPLRRDTIGST